MICLEKLDTLGIILAYDLPHRFTTYFYSQVARDLCSKAKVKDPRSLKAIDISERFGLGESFSESELRGVMGGAAAAYSAACATTTAYSSATSSASYATWAAASASSAAYSASTAYYYAAYASYYAAYASYKPLLLKLIQTRLTKVERLIIFGVEE